MVLSPPLLCGLHVCRLHPRLSTEHLDICLCLHPRLSTEYLDIFLCQQKYKNWKYVTGIETYMVGKRPGKRSAKDMKRQKLGMRVFRRACLLLDRRLLVPWPSNFLDFAHNPMRLSLFIDFPCLLTTSNGWSQWALTGLPFWVKLSTPWFAIDSNLGFVMFHYKTLDYLG